MSTTSEVGATEDWVHHPWPGDTWLESFWFGFYDPERKVGMVSLIGFNARDSRSRLWLELVEGDKVTVAATDLQLPISVPEGKTVEVGGFRVEVVSDLEEYALTYDGPEAKLDLRWHATTPVKSTTGPKPFPGQQEGHPRGHSEQVGTVSGSLTLQGREYQVDAARGWRDHLWGHAVSDGWSEMGWWAWLTGTTVDGSLSFNISAHRFPDGREGLYGFTYVGGEIRRVRVEQCDLEKDESGRHPLACVARWKDAQSGEEFELRGKIVAPLWIEEPVPTGVTYINDPPADYTLNGVQAYGTMEMGETYTS